MADISKIKLPGDPTTYNLKDANAARIWYGLCSTDASTAAKTVSITGFTEDNLVNGVKVVVKFNYGHTSSGTATMNVSSTGGKTIYYMDGTVNQKDAWGNNALITFTYYSGAWYMDRRDYLTLATLPIYDGTVV